MKKYTQISIDKKIICKKCEVAANPFTRFMGLMFRKGLDEDCGLILEPCNQIHTFNMRFDIDVVTTDKENKVLAVFDSVKPNKIKPVVKGGKKVIELNSGEIQKHGIKVGDVVSIKSL